MSTTNTAQLPEALSLALALHPTQDAAGAAVARTLLSLGRPQDALAYLSRHPSTDPHVWMDRAQAQRDIGEREAALASLDQALAHAPDWPDALSNRGLLLVELGRPTDALVALDQALVLQPDHLNALLHSANARFALAQPELALRLLGRVLSLQPANPDAQNGRAKALNELDRLDEALVALDDVLALRPDDMAARWNAALAHLALGDYRRGWPAFEHRWDLASAQPHRPRHEQPLWLGDTDLKGQRVLLDPEQGMGDTIQFCRYAPLLAARGATVLLRSPEPLVRLLGTLAGVTEVVAEGDAAPPFDLYCPLMSLPLALGTTLETIPANGPYLHAGAAALAAWRERVRPLPGLRVGLVWSGNPRPEDPDANAVDRRRSVALTDFAPLASVSGVSFVSLQKGEAAAQAADPPLGMVLHDWTDELADFADTAALIAALDLVISVDTSVVHLAGALGKPIWVLNRYAMCWRWLRGRTDSPWYPSARLFRQPVAGDWASVMEDVMAALRVEAERGPTV
jgi:tetratricopeptide (TPR) repeat protein